MTTSATMPEAIVRRWSRPAISSHCGRGTPHHSRTYGSDVNVRTVTENQAQPMTVLARRAREGSVRRSQRPKAMPRTAMMQKATNAE
ncbi:hypothetical protein GCM10009853_019380 [Glycomyces scopariae]|uniref:Uncharacterized protein n=1 Tax=Glycomyces sambucus TaxID=380244 RepID=A0A1G9JQ74_9ACTN|nr:hypothetical protein SAMN05216298_3804 [Glycomyces sambucus]